MHDSASGRGALLVGGIASILASSCCLGPLVLITLGFSGAWISSLTALEPWRPLFAAAALLALFVAWRRIWRPAGGCEPGQVCAVPQVNRVYRSLFLLVAALVGVALLYPFVLPLFH